MNILSSLLLFIGQKLQAEHNRIHISTLDPTSADGLDGDIWIKYTA